MLLTAPSAFPLAAGTRRPAPFRAAYVGVLVFTAVYFVRPEDWIPGLTNIRLAMIAGGLAIGTFVLSVVGSKANISRMPRECWYLVLLFGQLCAAVVFSSVWRGGAFEVVAYGFSKVVMMAIVIALTITTLARLRKLIFVQAFSVAVVAVLSLLKSRVVSGRLIGILGGNYDNPNDLSFAIAMATPCCWAFVFRTRNTLKKMVWIFFLVTMASAVFRTASRGGLLTLLVTSFTCMWEFGIKGKRKSIFALVGLGAVAFLALAPAKVLDMRFASIFKPSEDTSAYESAKDRQRLFSRGLEVTVSHPIFGIGPGNFLVVSGNWHVSHNTFTELAAEGGIPALVLFLLLLKESFSNLGTAKKFSGSQTEEALWGNALRASLVAFIGGACFASVPYQFFPYMLVAYTTVLRRITCGTGSNEPPSGPPRHTKAHEQKEDELAPGQRIVSYAR